MKNELPKLPIGLSDFANIREEGENYLYVDKTHQMGQLLQAGKYLFYSRPRRFGKSLLCSTLKYLYQGRHDLFKGLAIESEWNWDKTNPVIHLSLGGVGNTTPERLISNILAVLHDKADSFGVAVPNRDLPDYLIKLLAAVHAKTGRRVVVIIDEYEKPVHDHMEDIPVARQFRNTLAAFYGAMKDSDADIEKLFVTGVGRMVKTSIFSGFNQMVDFTMDPATAELCGYTQEELHRYFTPFIAGLAQANSMTIEEAWEKLRYRYNGYWWGYGEKVYNPWAILNCMRTGRFDNFWWSSGTPSMLVNMAPALTVQDDLENIVASDLMLQFDLENIKAQPLLWQTGYLTIKEVLGGLFRLGFPNAEVREAWSAAMLDHFAQNKNIDGGTIALTLLAALQKGDRKSFETTLISLFASIPHHLHLPKEAYYHSVFLAALNAVGGQVLAETATDKGRVDAVLKTRDYIYVIEFKLGTAENAMEQILQRRYFEPFMADRRKVVLLGAGGFAERNIHCQWQEMK